MIYYVFKVISFKIFFLNFLKFGVKIMKINLCLFKHLSLSFNPKKNGFLSVVHQQYNQISAISITNRNKVESKYIQINEIKSRIKA